jgi:hypothetical protein
MTNDILILAAGLSDVVTSGLSDGSYSGYNIAASTTTDPDAKLITDLAIFKPIQYVLKVASLFMLMLFGWKLITALTAGKSDTTPLKAIRNNIGFLIAAVLLWDISIFLSLLGVVKTAATALASSITSLVSGVK